MTQATVTIQCCPQNAKAFQAIIKSTPALLDLVQHLQANNLFLGLRAMAITITGAPATVAKGLDAWPDLYQASQTTG